MTKRRKFLQAATALSTAPIVGWKAFALEQENLEHEPLSSPSITIDAVIYDSRHSHSLDFGNRANQLGASVRAIEGDITDLWQNELRHRWKTESGAVVGLTERPALFLLERLAWDNGMRVVFEAEHSLDPHGNTAHRIVRAANENLPSELEAAEQSWPSNLAANLIECSHNATCDFRPSGAAMAAYLGEPILLHSWIIAPRTAG